MLKSKNAVITGTNRGLGRTLLEVFAKYGANIFTCVRNIDEEFLKTCYALSNLYGVKIKPLEFDLTDEQAMKAAVKLIKDEKCNVDILVNNAGVVPENRLFNMASETEMYRVFEINFFAAMRLIKLISKLMIRQKFGSIVNITSISALDGEPGQVEYVSSKAALIGATKKLASELGNFNIRVNAVAAGVINTGVSASMDEKLKESVINRTVMKRLGESEEVANVTAFLASDLSGYMTGQVLRVDGGL